MEFKVLSGASASDTDRQLRLRQSLGESPLPDAERLVNPGLFIERPVLSRILYMDLLYRQIVDVHGVIMEFGVRWGQNMALFSNLRGIYEPFNYNRKIVGFDTFSGFPSVDPKDGSKLAAGDYSVAPDYAQHLDALLSIHEEASPIPHKKKHELVVGDATQTFPAYLERHPETIVALAYFDFDIYEPTKVCLERVMPHLVKGSILAFDELNAPDFPGETLAVMETLGLRNYHFKRTPLNPLCAYVVIE
jgi:hypothetical protein